MEFVIFFFLGLPILLISLFTDSFYFFLHLYDSDITKMSSYDRPMINLQGFVILLKYTQRKIDEAEYEGGNKMLPMMNFVTVLREKIAL